MTWDLADAAITACRDEFGGDVVYRPAAGGAEALTAVFDEAFKEVTFSGDGAPVAGSRPVLDIRLADLAVTPVEGDELDVAGYTWEVVEVERDGRGAAKLYLHRVGVA